MLKKDIINSLFTREDNKHLYTVFSNRAITRTYYCLICLDDPCLIETYGSIRDLKDELRCGYTVVGRFEELDIESMIQEKTLHEETY